MGHEASRVCDDILVFWASLRGFVDELGDWFFPARRRGEGGKVTWFYECVGVVVLTCWAVGMILFF